MESDEKYIERRFGKKTPFAVPEGYFENLAQSIVDSVAAEPAVQAVAEKREDAAKPVARIGWWHRYRMRVAVAACVAFVVAGVAAYLSLPSVGADASAAVAAHGDNASSVQPAYGVSDAEIDYTMLDNEAIYSLVASN